MCGVAGIWGCDEPRTVREMMDRLVHRGPDASGLMNRSEGVLGHRRLSIMDPAGGNQPLHNEDRTCSIIANGEIYNFETLRQELEPEHEFRTRSDTESILHLYEEGGDDAVARLDGMFAFAIADGPGILLARDPIGIKPLYYGRRDGDLVFASELKALVDVADEVHEFPPGHYFRPVTGFQSFYDLPDHEPVKRTLDDHQAAVRQTLTQSVAKRLMSDVPLGAFLSGGLDSSIIAAIARQHLDELHTFSVGLEGSTDLQAARTVARALDTVHHEYVFTAREVEEHLPEIIYHLESFDQDLVRSAVPCYFVSRLAADHVKVILTGEGADELFAGYTYYRDIEDATALRNELRRSIAALHNINLQRVDRLTMAHSIEGRVPFLDLEMIDVAQNIPPQLKLHAHPDTTSLIEKWILRMACADLLPDEILWRTKEQFDEGSGTTDIMTSLTADVMTPGEAHAHRARHPGTSLRSREECVYHRTLLEVFPEPELVLQNVARWAQRPATPTGPDGLRPGV